MDAMKYTAYSVVYLEFVTPDRDVSDIYQKVYDFQMQNKIFACRTIYHGPVTKDYRIEQPLRTRIAGYYCPEDAEKLIAFLKEIGLTEDEESDP